VSVPCKLQCADTSCKTIKPEFDEITVEQRDDEETDQPIIKVSFEGTSKKGYVIFRSDDLYNCSIKYKNNINNPIKDSLICKIDNWSEEGDE
jgi:hypothetical protein